MIQGISHITLVVKDLERSAVLFKELLGGEEVYSSGEDTFSLSREKFFIVAGQWFAVMEGEVLERPSYEHIAFRIDEAELTQYEAKIKDMGFRLKDPRPRVSGEGQSLYFYDTDGHLFELHTGTLEERLQRYRASGGQ